MQSSSFIRLSSFMQSLLTLSLLEVHKNRTCSELTFIPPSNCLNTPLFDKIERLDVLCRYFTNVFKRSLDCTKILWWNCRDSSRRYFIGLHLCFYPSGKQALSARSRWKNATRLVDWRFL